MSSEFAARLQQAVDGLDLQQRYYGEIDGRLACEVVALRILLHLERDGNTDGLYKLTQKLARMVEAMKRKEDYDAIPF